MIAKLAGLCACAGGARIQRRFRSRCRQAQVSSAHESQRIIRMQEEEWRREEEALVELATEESIQTELLRATRVIQAEELEANSEKAFEGLMAAIRGGSGRSSPSEWMESMSEDGQPEKHGEDRSLKVVMATETIARIDEAVLGQCMESTSDAVTLQEHVGEDLPREATATEDAEQMDERGVSPAGSPMTVTCFLQGTKSESELLDQHGEELAAEVMLTEEEVEAFDSWLSDKMDGLPEANLNEPEVQPEASGDNAEGATGMGPREEIPGGVDLSHSLLRPRALVNELGGVKPPVSLMAVPAKGLASPPGRQGTLAKGAPVNSTSHLEEQKSSGPLSRLQARVGGRMHAGSEALARRTPASKDVAGEHITVGNDMAQGSSHGPTSPPLSLIQPGSKPGPALNRAR